MNVYIIQVSLFEWNWWNKSTFWWYSNYMTSTYIYIYIYTIINLHINISVCVCMYVSMCVYIYIYIYFFFFFYIYITFIYNFWWFRSTSGWQSKDCFREQIANAKIEINKSAFWTNLPLNVVMREYKLSKWSGVSLSVVVHRGFVFMEHLVISTHCHTEDNGCHILKAVNPFFPLWSLSPHIKQPGDETSHTFRTHAKPCTCMCAHTQETQCMLRNKIGQPKISDLHRLTCW